MKKRLHVIPSLLLLLSGLIAAACGDIDKPADLSNIPAVSEGQAPDYGAWNQLLAEYATPEGVDYAGLIENDKKKLDQLRLEMASVDVDSLSKPDQLAYWINLYNINTIATVTDHYPVESIRDISTDPVVRLNVFKNEIVPFHGGFISLDAVENEHVRPLGDARIHFAINCAAESCPPVASEAFTGEMIEDQLDKQTRTFLAGPNGVRLEESGDSLQIHTTKIMDWFSEDFDEEGGAADFIAEHVDSETAQRIRNTVKTELIFDDYSWKLNDVGGS